MGPNHWFLLQVGQLAVPAQDAEDILAVDLAEAGVAALHHRNLDYPVEVEGVADKKHQLEEAAAVDPPPLVLAEEGVAD